MRDGVAVVHSAVRYRETALGYPTHLNMPKMRPEPMDGKKSLKSKQITTLSPA